MASKKILGKLGERKKEALVTRKKVLGCSQFKEGNILTQFKTEATENYKTNGAF